MNYEDPIVKAYKEQTEKYLSQLAELRTDRNALIREKRLRKESSLALPTNILIFVGSALPTLGRLAELTGILPVGKTFSVVSTIAGCVTTVIDAAVRASSHEEKKQKPDRLVQLKAGDMV